MSLYFLPVKFENNFVDLDVPLFFFSFHHLEENLDTKGANTDFIMRIV